MVAEVRPLTIDELEQAIPLIAGYQRFYGVESPDDDRNRAFFRRFIAPSEDGLLLGAWEATDLAGFATLYWSFSSTLAADVVLMNDLFVRPDARGGGIGRALIQASVDVAKARGAPHVEWLTAIDNRLAQGLYERVGAARSAWFGYEIPT